MYIYTYNMAEGISAYCHMNTTHGWRPSWQHGPYMTFDTDSWYTPDTDTWVWYMTPDTRLIAHDSWEMTPDTRPMLYQWRYDTSMCHLYNTRLVHDSWYMIHDSWHILWHIWLMMHDSDKRLINVWRFRPVCFKHKLTPVCLPHSGGGGAFRTVQSTFGEETTAG